MVEVTEEVRRNILRSQVQEGSSVDLSLAGADLPLG